MLFSNHGWAGLDGKRIGITDDTATSVRLLQVLLEKKYNVKATFERLHAGINDHAGYDAVLLIGDEALRRNKFGLSGFEIVYDLAKEWYDWKKMPFVFAVWAVGAGLAAATKTELGTLIERSLSSAEGAFGEIGALHGRQIGLAGADVEQYLEGFNFRLGDREREAMKEFRKLVFDLDNVLIQ
jgi:chorismate dehydratase